MDIKRNPITLVENTFAYLYRVDAQEIALTFKNNVFEYVQKMLYYIPFLDFQKVSDKDFYKMLNSLYSIYFTDSDRLNILTQKNKKEYVSFLEIRTFMTFKNIATEKCGRHDFNWWEQLYQVYYTVAVTKNALIEEETTLTKKEIERLLNSKDIMIVAYKTEPIEEELSYQEGLEEFPITNLNFERFLDDLEPKNEDAEIKHIITRMLRQKFTKKRILHDLKKYLESLEEQIESVLSFSEDELCGGKIQLTCKSYFDNSEEKKILESVRKRIRENN